MKHPCLSMTLFLSAFSALPCEAALKVYFLRHAQTGANAEKQWEGTPATQRPDYVGNASTFTPEGESQVLQVPKKLAAYKFDFIIVSPLWRTRQTILPYLQEQNRSGEIWPELTEFNKNDGDLSLIATANLPEPATDVFTAGKNIKLSEAEQAHLTLRTDGLTEVKRGRGGAEGAADITIVLKRLVERLKTNFSGTDKSILLVGHGNSGRELIALMTDNQDAKKHNIANTGLWMMEEQPNGSFKVKIANDLPVEPK